jgi:hypothetical protein
MSSNAFDFGRHYIWMIEIERNEKWESIHVGSFSRARGRIEIKLYKKDMPQQKFRLVEYQFERVKK